MLGTSGVTVKLFNLHMLQCARATRRSRVVMTFVGIFYPWLPARRHEIENGRQVGCPRERPGYSP